MNFQIKESYTRKVPEYYEDFKKDYLNPKIQVKQIMKKYGLSKNNYNRLRKKAAKDTNVPIKPTKFSPNRNKLGKTTYISKTGDFYTINKRVEGKRVYFGRYPSLEEAIYVRDKLKKCGWDKSKLKQIKKELKDEFY